MFIFLFFDVCIILYIDRFLIYNLIKRIIAEEFLKYEFFFEFLFFIDFLMFFIWLVKSE